MRAVVIRDGGILVEARPDPEPGSGEVLVRVRAAGLNGADLLQRAGSYPVPPGVPADMPGMEFAGEVLRNGPRAERFNVGDRVMGLIAGAGQAELVVVHERLLMPVPAKLDWPAAGGLPEVFTTAEPRARACRRPSATPNTARWWRRWGRPCSRRGTSSTPVPST